MTTPSITPAQIKACILWLFSALALLGVNVGGGTQDAILLVVEGFIITILPTALVVADMAIRRARAANAAAIAEAKVAVAQIEPTPARAFVPED